ncbi:sensor histidine kinase [Arenibaculum pallidiluteum]|uniref:sensor histidine kinase n=1 Tax=Arenibaculum pallidiluteum TaxID=2812559 RepID=UPI001A9653BF|nr:sensor histidine kinase [Arenibaculum pallidiluteum]
MRDQDARDPVTDPAAARAAPLAAIPAANPQSTVSSGPVASLAAGPAAEARRRTRKGWATIGLTMFSLAVIVAATVWLGLEARRDVRGAAERLAEDSTFFLADHAARLFEASSLVLTEATNEVSILPWEALAVDRRTWDRLKAISDRFPYVEDIWLNDAEGTLRLSTTAWPSPHDNASDRENFQASERPGSGDYVGPRIVGRVTGRPTFLMSRRLEWPDGQFRGMVSITLDIAYFETFYRSLNLRFGAGISLVREAGGDALIHVGPHGENSVPAGRRADQPPPDTAAFAIRHVPDLPLLVAVSVPGPAVRETLMADLRIYGAVGALSLLGLGLLSSQVLRQTRADRAAQQELERRVVERTAALTRAKVEMEILFQEVHHRVKNNLQVVTSLLRLQSARIEDERVREGLRESIDRIHAMALVHKLLYASNELADLDFAVYLGTLISHLEEAYGTQGRVRVTVDAAPARFGLDAAIPLSLIVNETFSNALKHAFPDGRPGTVRIGLSAMDDGSWLLTQDDDGVGLPPGYDWRASRGLGMQIIKSLAIQLQGEAGFETGGGTHFRLVFRPA